MKILAVDDDRLNITMITEILGGEHDLRTANSGEEALAVTSRFRPDLILLDVMMPGIDGYETCRQIRKNPDLNGVKILLVSAKSLTKERLKGYEVGADDYVTKPFNADELLAKVRVFLRLRSVEEIDRMQRQLISLVAHEIRTPLTGIVPAGEMLSGESPMEDEERRMWGQMIVDNSHRLLDMAEKGLLVAQFTARQVALNLETLDLADLAETAVRGIDAPDRRDNVELVVGERPLMVDGEKRYLKIVLQAVLDNALKYSPAESKVSVELGGGEKRARFTITNTGPEVDPEEVFSAFSPRRVEDQVIGSGGMSMALSRAIMRAHGGDVQIETKPFEGTVCTGWLPLHSAVAATSDWD